MDDADQRDSTGPALRPAVRARRVRRRVRRGRRRALAGAGPAPRPGRPGRARPSRRVRCRRRLERWRRRRPAAGALGPGPHRRPGLARPDRPSLMLFLPRDRAGARAGASARRDDVRRGGSAGRRLARGPRRPGRPRRGRRGDLSDRRPGHRRPPDARPRTTPGRSPTSLRAPARRGPPSPGARRQRGRPAPRQLSIPSASARTVVYKGLVAGGRLADLYPDLRDAARRRRTRSSTSATPRTRRRPGRSPSRSGPRPQRRDQHRPRQSRAGPRPDRATGAAERSPPS